MHEEEKKRMVETYEITQAIRIGDREILFGVDEKQELPYFCGFYRINAHVGEYSECMAGDDYVEMMELFADRIKTQCEKVREEWAKVTVPREKITEQMCIPLSKCDNLKGKVMAVRPEVLRPEYRSAEHQLVYVRSGNGIRSNSFGTACYCTNLYDGENVRWERYDFQGEVKPENLPLWARERVEEVRKQETEKVSLSQEVR